MNIMRVRRRKMICVSSMQRKGLLLPSLNSIMQQNTWFMSEDVLWRRNRRIKADEKVPASTNVNKHNNQYGITAEKVQIFI